MKLNKEQTRNAKNMNKHELADLMKSYNETLEEVERIKKANNLDKLMDYLDFVRATLDVATGRKTTDCIDMRAVYTDPVEQYAIPATSAKSLYFSDPDEFTKLSGTVKEFTRFVKFEAI